MLLDLRGIIDLPGGKIKFDYSPDLSDITGGSVTQIISQPKASGKVSNNAGLLTLTCTLDAVCLCTCARCLKEFEYTIHKDITADITESGEGENPDGYYITADRIDVTQIITTELILSIDNKLLCKEDCAGLCQGCGADLNNDKCSCTKETDPRLAVLKQLLDN